MLIIPPSEYRPRRGRRKPRQPEAPAGLNITAVTDVSYGGDVLSFLVVFDTTEGEPLVDIGAADPAKWTARYSGGLFEGVSLVMVNFDMVEVGMTVVGAEAGPNVCAYSNAPSDIGDSLGRMLAAFSEYPL